MGAADLFRRSSLPARGIRLYVNLVDTSFGNFGGDFGKLVPDWWYETFSEGERHEWAVMDRHKYYSWDKECSGCDGPGEACAWSCDVPNDVARDATIACRDIDLARNLVQDQVAAFRSGNVEGFFWSWRIPYGPIFQSGWSLKYLAGVEEENLSHECVSLSEQHKRQHGKQHGRRSNPLVTSV